MRGRKVVPAPTSVGGLRRNRAVLLLFLVMLLVWSAFAASAAEAAWPPPTFPISGWCSPPEPYITADQYKRIAEAGFTVLMPPCEGVATVDRNRKILTTAHAVGLKVIIADSRMPLSIQGNANAEATLKSIVADYHRYPALMGYFLTDEPGANQFAGLGDVAAVLHRLDPEHLVYINLFPNYASNDLSVQPSQLNADNYDQYLERYIRVVKPDVLSWDHYFFLNGSDRPGFLGNLAAAQRAVSQTNTPFWQIVLSVQHGGYRALNENELRFEAMQTLVYGGKGLVYFTYWLPNDTTFQWSHGIMEQNGMPGPLYEPVKRINHEVQSLEKWLYGARVLETYQTGDVPPDGKALPDTEGVKVEDHVNLSLGEFRDGKGYVYFLVTNRDYQQPASTKIDLDIGMHRLEQLDLGTNRWRAVTGPKNADGEVQISVQLAPSGAALYRWL